MATNGQYVHETSSATSGESEPPVRNPALWVELEVDSHDDACPLSGLSNTAASGRVQLTGDRCHATITFDGTEGEEVSVHTGSIRDSCACARVCGPGFTPVSLAIESGSLLVRAYVDSRAALSAVIESLRESDDEWRLRRLTTPDRNRTLDGGIADQLFEDLTVTQKQREAVRAAVEMGYYAEPREATLGDLTDRLGVSRSAVSQRLNAVESKLIESLSAEL